MSLSKRFYEEGYLGKIECKHPLLDTGQRFTINFGRLKITQGTWEIVSNEKAPLYLCRRVIQNGDLSKSSSLENNRNFYEHDIYRSLDK